MKRKIAGCVNVRIRAGDYQHIEVVKYAEEEIEYSSKEELKEKEDALNSDLVDCLFRSLKSTASKLGKGQAEAIEVEESISKAIPAWLANDAVPNIANQAIKVLNTVADKQKAEKDKAIKTEKSVIMEEVDSKMVKDSPVIENVKKTEDSGDVGDLFEPDVPLVSPSKTEVSEVVPVVEAKKDQDDGFDLFSGAEDLFGDK